MKRKAYPLMSPIRRRMVARSKPFESWPLLNFVVYNKKDAKETIINKLNWRDYGGKHYESVFTRFYQGYILPTKFKVDKRKAHLSNLIFSGQISKEEALAELQEPIYPAAIFDQDLQFVLKKLGYTEQAFQDYLTSAAVPHAFYNMSLSIFDEYSVLKPFKFLFNK